MKGDFASTLEAFSRITLNLSKLRTSEKKVADYVLAHPKEVIFLSISELAKTTETSEATITRFCRSVGFDGYQELKIGLTGDLAKSRQPEFEAESWNKDVEPVVDQVMRANISCLENIKTILDMKEFKRAVEAIASAKKVGLYGIGGSGILAQAGSYMFSKLGVPAFAYNDPYLQIVSATQLAPDDVGIGISYSGNTAETIRCLSLVKKNGAKTICITSFMKSPITEYADIVLLATRRALSVFGVTTRTLIPLLSILDALYIGLALTRKDFVLEKFQDFEA